MVGGSGVVGGQGWVVKGVGVRDQGVGVLGVRGVVGSGGGGWWGSGAAGGQGVGVVGIRVVRVRGRECWGQGVGDSEGQEVWVVGSGE